MIDVSVENVGPCKKLLKIRVPKEDVQAKLDESYEKLRDTASVDGFRKRHVPRRLLERRFGEQLLEDLKQSLMADASAEAVEKEDLKLLGEPSFDSAEFKPDEDFNFEVTVETRPEFDIDGYKGLALTRPSTAVNDDEVEQGLQNFLRSRAAWEDVADGAIEAGDRITADWLVRVDDEVAVSDDDDHLEVRDGVFSALGATGFAEKMAGAKSGETRTLDVQFPDDDPNEKYRGKKGVLEVTPKEIRRANIPAVNAAMLKELDFDTEDELREEVRRQLGAAKQREAQQALEHQAEDRLLDKVDFELPEGLVKRQASEQMRRQQMRLLMQGVPQEEVNKHLDELRTSSEEAAARSFRLAFILQKIAEKEKVFVTENEVETMVAGLANRHGMSTRKMEQEMEQRDQLASLRTEMRHEKVVRLLLDEATIEDAAQ